MSSTPYPVAAMVIESDAILFRGVKFVMAGMDIDPCPECGGKVESVAVPVDRPYALPCNHPVVPTVFPGLLMLADLDGVRKSTLSPTVL